MGASRMTHPTMRKTTFDSASMPLTSGSTVLAGHVERHAEHDRDHQRGQDVVAGDGADEVGPGSGWR